MLNALDTEGGAASGNLFWDDGKSVGECDQRLKCAELCSSIINKWKTINNMLTY